MHETIDKRSSVKTDRRQILKMAGVVAAGGVAAITANTTQAATSTSAGLLAETYADLRGLNPAPATGDVITVTGEGIAGDFVVETGSPSDDGGITIVFNNNATSNKYAKRRFSGPVNIEWFGASPSLSNNKDAIQAAINTGIKTIVPGKQFDITDSLVIGASEHLHLMNGATIWGKAPTSKPVIRIVADHAKLTGDGHAYIRTDNQTGDLNDPTLEGIVNGGPLTTTSPKVDLNWVEIRGIHFVGNIAVWNNFANGINLEIDKYTCLKFVNGQALPNIGAGSVYNTYVTDCLFSYSGIGIDCGPVVQGNNFNNLYFYQISKAGVQFVGAGENSIDQTFFHGGPCHNFIRIESAPLLIANVTGEFLPNDVVTGTTSGATLTLYENVPWDAGKNYLYGVRNGAFAAGEMLTGSLSGATAFVDASRFQFAMTGEGVGRPSAGNSFTNIMGEPSSDAPQTLGGRYSMFFYCTDGNDFNYLQGRGNTGHAWEDYGNNTVIERGQIDTRRPIYARDIIYATTIEASGDITLNGNLLNNGIIQHTAYNGPINTGESIRMAFTGADRESYQFKVRVSGYWGASNTPSRHPSGEFMATVLTNSSSTTINTDGFTAIYERNFPASNITATAQGSGYQFNIDIANPSIDELTGFSVIFEVVSANKPTLNSVTII